MSEQQAESPVPPIANEAEFCRALGINPDTVKSGSLEVKIINGQPTLTFTSMFLIPARALGMAFMASAPHEEMPPQVKTPQDRKPKATPRKRAPRKTAAKKDTTSE
jgi:hypothetical protein